MILNCLNKKNVSNKTNYLVIENELNKLKASDLSYFGDKSYFLDDGTQNRLVFQPISRYFKVIDVGNRNILSWKFKEFSDESIKPSTASNKIFIGTKSESKV